MNRIANFLVNLVGFCLGAALYTSIIGTAVSLLGHRPLWPSIVHGFLLTLIIFSFRAVHKLVTQ